MYEYVRNKYVSLVEGLPFEEGEEMSRRHGAIWGLDYLVKQTRPELLKASRWSVF